MTHEQGFQDNRNPQKQIGSPGPIAFDIDDTLLRHYPQCPVFTDHESILANCIPIESACLRVRDLIEAGREVHFITGRSTTVKAATLTQLQAWISNRIQPEQVHCNGAWAGYDALQRHKAERLRGLGAVLMVGDHATDEAAAREAGIRFLHAEVFATAGVVM